ncbi:type II toxin-antitoxin system HicB family antitoxin [uncultured Thiodictyon sp.]|uniref:type II toxin-antitoxin system HicB family antitoxin n=1 Tax=uncultured Thiodictyon sp. TaxID=1846217 RepID=UPI0025EB19B0|nr:type II toxin-antitoxin system HicB family antitoxin [uncultured Thiodictyon sp.]
MFDFPVILEPDPETGTVLVSFPDLPFCHSVGDDEDEALLNAVDALETALAVLITARRPLPVPLAPAGRPTVRPSALECAKLGVYQAMTEQGIRKAELARRLGWHLPQVDRLLDLGHASRFDQIEAAARALGKRIEIRVA